MPLLQSWYFCMLSHETVARIEVLFKAEERVEAACLLNEQCGNNLPFLGKLDCHELERYQFAALKISKGDVSNLRKAVNLAQSDWRDLLMAAGFGSDVHAHENWIPLSQNEDPP